MCSLWLQAHFHLPEEAIRPSWWPHSGEWDFVIIYMGMARTSSDHVFLRDVWALALPTDIHEAQWILVHDADSGTTDAPLGRTNVVRHSARSSCWVPSALSRVPAYFTQISCSRCCSFDRARRRVA